mmetsp:Transcript_85778/g.161521  ORF Transcript_85778/g.161521 Transcript_85778/m.161521 type:complete len:127 (+) Transcript_85778:3-383(+)
MFVKGYVVDMRIKIKEDVLKLLAENLKQSEVSLQHVETMMRHVAQLVENSATGKDQDPIDAGQRLPAHAPDWSELERNLNRTISTQVAESLRAIQQQTPIFQYYGASQRFCGSPKVLAPMVLPRGD